MNLILGLFIPLANEQKNFFKVVLRLLQINAFRPLGRLSVAKPFGSSVFSIQKNKKYNCNPFPCIRPSLATRGQIFASAFTNKQRDGTHQKMPSRDIFLVGPCAQSPSGSILELVGLNPSLI